MGETHVRGHWEPYLSLTILAAAALVIAIVPMQTQAQETLDGHFPVHVQTDPYAETSGKPGAPDSTTTTDGNYIPSPSRSPLL